MTVYIRNAKNNKDLYSLLSEKTLKDLRAYYTQWKPRKYLFKSPNGMKYSGKSVGAIVARAALKANIKRRVTPPAPKTQEKLKENLEKHINMIQKNSARVAKYFKHESIKYAA